MRRRRTSPLLWWAGEVRRWEGWPDYIAALGWAVAVCGILVGLAVVATALGARA